MKKLIVIISAILLVSLAGYATIYQYLKANSPTVPVPIATPSPLPTKIEKRVQSVSYKNEQYAYSYFIVQNPANLSLIPNFSHPKDAESLMSENNCTSVINGGFYDKQNKPLGFFQANEKEFGAKLDSELVNGFVWADASGSALISTELPTLTFRFALQTGPVLIFNGKVQPLRINNDTPSRRMIAARNNDLLFLTVYNENSVYEGPLLGDLPQIIRLISDKESLGIEDAINLDGGTASAFYTGDTKLSELTSVGSLFCQKSK